MQVEDTSDLRKEAVFYAQVLDALKIGRAGRASRYNKAVVQRFIKSRMSRLMGSDAPLEGLTDTLNRTMAGEPQDFVDRHFLVQVVNRMQTVIDADRRLTEAHEQIAAEERARTMQLQAQTQRALYGML